MNSFAVPPASNRDSAPADKPALNSRAGAISIIEQILALDAIAPPAPRILEHCHAAARVMAQRLSEPGFHPESDEEIAALCAGQHPWRHLLELAVHYETLPVGRWQHLHQTVSRALGPEIAGAAARGKLRLSHGASSLVWRRLSTIDSLIGECLEPPMEPNSTTEPVLASETSSTIPTSAALPAAACGLNHRTWLASLLLVAALVLVFGTALRLKAAAHASGPSRPISTSHGQR